MILSFDSVEYPPAATCRLPAPWHCSQATSCIACPLRRYVLERSPWQAAHCSSPTFSAPGMSTNLLKSCRILSDVAVLGLFLAERVGVRRSEERRVGTE